MIEETKKIILNALKNNTRENTKTVYAFTNENMRDYLKGINNECTLSICSSGDQYFNLVGLNAKEIDLVDTNFLTEYYTLGIKQH